MLAKERQRVILDMLYKKHVVKTVDIAKEFGITDLTARKDLDSLREQGFVERVYGGAVLLPISTGSFAGRERNINSNYLKTYDEKIAEFASKMVEEGDKVFLGNDQIVLEVAKYLIHIPNLTFITASMQTAVFLMSNGCSIYLLGGKIDPIEHNIYSRSAMLMMEKFFPTKTIISCDGITAEHGPTTEFQPGAELGNISIRNAEKAILVVPSIKFGHNAMNKVCDFSDLYAIVTDDDLPTEYREKMEKIGVQMFYTEMNDK